MDNETKELKPCPGCNSKAVYIAADGFRTIDNHQSHWCACDNVLCPCSRVVFTVDQWNTRPIEDALRAENESQYAGLTEQVNKMAARLKEAEALILEIADHVDELDLHEWSCASTWVDGSPCSCGGSDTWAKIQSIKQDTAQP
jgi:hypothetical protein